MKANIARCVHGRVWFRPCDQCDLAEAIWLDSLKSENDINDRPMIVRFGKRLFPCRMVITRNGLRPLTNKDVGL